MTAVDRDLIERNRRTAARREGWPLGALAICEQLDAAHPGWTITWMGENRIAGWERPAGFAAHRSDWSAAGADELRRLPEDCVARDPMVFGPSVPELAERIAAADARHAAWREAQAERSAYWRARYRVHDDPPSVPV